MWVLGVRSRQQLRSTLERAVKPLFKLFGGSAWLGLGLSFINRFDLGLAQAQAKLNHFSLNRFKNRFGSSSKTSKLVKPIKLKSNHCRFLVHAFATEVDKVNTMIMENHAYK